MYTNNFEIVPQANSHLQFPGGDIDERSANGAFRFLDEIANDTVDEALKRLGSLRRMELGYWRSLPGNQMAFDLVSRLGEDWAERASPEDEEAQHIAIVGIHQTIAFNKKTSLLPLDLTHAQAEISDLSQLSSIDVFEFSQTNWKGMLVSHPRVFAALSKWHAYLAELIRPSDEREQLLMATVGLPYALAVSTRMRNYLTRDMDHSAELLIKRTQAES